MREALSRAHRPEREAKNPLTRRLLWFAALWAAGVGTVGAVAYVIRAAIL